MYGIVVWSITVGCVNRLRSAYNNCRKPRFTN